MTQSLWARTRKAVESPLARRFATGAAWSLIGAVAARSANVVTWIVLARMLGRAGFGELGIIQSTLGVFTALAGFGFGTTATKYVAEFRQKDPERAGRIVGLSGLVVIGTGLAGALAVFFLAPTIAQRALGAGQLDDLLRLGSALIFLSALNGAQIGALTGFEAFKAVSLANTFSALVTLPLAALGAWKFGAQGALLALVVSGGVNCVLMRIALKRETRRFGVPIRYKGCLVEWPVIYRFTLPALMSLMLAAPVAWIGNAMLMRQANGASEMGLVTAANQWYYALLFIPGIFFGNSLPMLTERLGQDDISACRSLIKYSLRVNLLIVVPVVIAGMMAGSLIMGLYGPEFRGDALPLICALLTAAVVSAQMPVGQVMAAAGLMWVEGAMNLAHAVVFCVGAWLLISHGATGLLGARLIAYLAHLVWTWAFVFWFLREREHSSC